MKDQEPQETNTNSGAFIGGDVNIDRGGTFAGRDIVGYTSEQVCALLTQIASTFQPKPFDGRCPYLGLDAFTEDDADRFFGRERLVKELLERVKANRFVLIAGPSGSGKSSLARAGLLHALKQGGLPDLHSERWLYTTITPGRNPIEALASAVSQLKSPEVGDYLREHVKDADTLHKCAESALSDRRDQRAVIFVDQFEEVFTQIAKEEARTTFLNLLTRAATIEDGRVTVLLAMRSDFVSNCATYPALSELINQASQFMLVGAMQPAELVSAIAQPALRVGLKIDPDLIVQIVNDMGDEPGTLPLMQFALKDLFDAQQIKGGVVALTLSDYLARGGLHKALERHAEESFKQLADAEQQLARTIFSGLIQPGHGTTDTRRVTALEELVPAHVDRGNVETVIRKLADARLLTTDEKDHHVTVTLAHETLIDAWPWLRKLVDENREAILLQNQIVDDAQEWERSGRNSSYLYSGIRLANVSEQLAAKKIALGDLAQMFVRASQSQLQRRQIGLTSGAIAIIGALVLAVIVFSTQSNENAILAAQKAQIAATAQAAEAQAVEQGSEAKRQAATAQAASTAAIEQRNEALRQAQLARAGELTAHSQAIRQDYPQRGLLLTLEALGVTSRAGEPATIETLQTLYDALHDLSGIGLAGYEGQVGSVAFSPDGHWLVTTGGKLFSPPGSNTALVWDLSSPEVASSYRTLDGHAAAIGAIAISSDSRWLATGSEDKTVKLWDLTANDPSSSSISLTGHTEAVLAVAFSPDGHWLVTADRSPYALGIENPSIRVWNLELLPQVDSPIILNAPEDGTRSLSISPNGRWLVAGGGGRTPLMVWDLQASDVSASARILQGHQNGVYSTAISSDSRWLASGDADNTIRVWDLAAQDPQIAPIILHSHDGDVAWNLAFSPDAQWLISGGMSKTVHLWDLKSQDPEANSRTLQGQEGKITTLTVSANGRWLFAGDDNTLRFWDLSATDIASSSRVLRGYDGNIAAIGVSRDGQWLVGGSVDGTARLWNLPSAIGNPSMQPVVLDGHRIYAQALAVNLTGDQMAAYDGANVTTVWDFAKQGLWLNSAYLEGGIDLTRQYTLLGFSSEMVMSLNGQWVAFVPGSLIGPEISPEQQKPALRLWHLPTPNSRLISYTLKTTADHIGSIAISPDAHWLAASTGVTTTLWDLRTPALNVVSSLFMDQSSAVDASAFSLDSKCYATGGWDGSVTLWQIDTSVPVLYRVIKSQGGPVVALHVNNYCDALVTVNGKTNASTNVRGDIAILTVQIWNSKTLTPTLLGEAVLPIHEGSIHSVSISPNGHWLATGDDSGTTRLWDLARITTESAPIVLSGHKQPITAVAFSGNGSWLVTGAWDHLVSIWNLQVNELFDIACRTAGRNLTQAEWQQYFPHELYRKTCPQWPEGQ